MTEAILFGLSQGLDMKKILDVVHALTGQNTAVSDKFPKRVLTRSFDAGFYAERLDKDVLRRRGRHAQPDRQRDLQDQKVTDVLKPQSDFALIYEIMRNKTNVPE